MPEVPLGWEGSSMAVNIGSTHREPRVTPSKFNIIIKNWTAWITFTAEIRLTTIQLIHLSLSVISMSLNSVFLLNYLFEKKKCYSSHGISNIVSDLSKILGLFLCHLCIVLHSEKNLKIFNCL